MPLLDGIKISEFRIMIEIEVKGLLPENLNHQMISQAAYDFLCALCGQKIREVSEELKNPLIRSMWNRGKKIRHLGINENYLNQLYEPDAGYTNSVLLMSTENLPHLQLGIALKNNPLPSLQNPRGDRLNEFSLFGTKMTAQTGLTTAPPDSSVPKTVSM